MKRLLTTVAVGLSAVTALSQGTVANQNPKPGSLDLTFTAAKISGIGGYATRLILRSDGKVFIGGSFDQVNGVKQTCIALLNSNGSLDGTFNNAAYSGTVYAVALQSNGKLLVGGQYGMTRLNVDGTSDRTFKPSQGADYTYSFALQNDGKILVGGNMNLMVEGQILNIVRVNIDGTLDSTFTPGTVSSHINAIALQSDGKVLVGGSFTKVNGIARKNIVRLNSNGALDSTFSPGSGPDDEVRAIVVQRDGKVVIGGKFAEVSGVDRSSIARLNLDGTVDKTFDPGTGADQSIDALVVQGDGKVLIGGSFTRVSGMSRNSIARLNSDGTLDETFAPSFGTGQITAIALQSDRKILIGGRVLQANGAVVGIVRLYGDPVNMPPTIANISSQNITTGSVVGPLSFALGDLETPNSLTVTGSSSNPTLVPASGITINGAGTNRTVTITSAPGQSGTTTIQLTVSDGSLSATSSFAVTVNAAPAAPPAEFHPADTNKDSSLALAEVLSYATAFKRGTDWPVDPNPILLGYVIRGFALYKTGERYRYDDTSGSAPAAWVSDVIKP